MCMFKTDREFKLLNAADRYFVFWGREQAASILATFCLVSCLVGTSFELIGAHFYVPPLCFHERLRFLGNAFFRVKSLM